jgi:hypothetical protein
LQTAAAEGGAAYEAGSPSEAFAGVTLNSDAISDIGAADRDSIGHGTEQDTSSPLKYQAGRAEDSSPMRGLNSRSASPAKRRASEMDGEQTHDHPDKMDVDSSKSQAQTAHAQDASSAMSSTPTSTRDSSGNGTESSVSTEVETEEPKPSLDKQVESVVAQISQRPEGEGLAGYVISRQWLGRVVARSKFNEEMGPFDKDSLEGEIGPVNNESVIASGSFLPTLLPVSF